MEGPERAAANAELLFMALLFLMFAGGGVFFLTASRRLQDEHRRQAEEIAGWWGDMIKYFNTGWWGEANVWGGRFIGAAFILSAGAILAMITGRLGLT